MSIATEARRLKTIIDNTDTDKLDSLKDSISISDMPYVLKKACMESIDFKQGNIDCVQSAIIEHSEVKMGEL